MENVSYDGNALYGRFLISPVGTALRIDKRFISTADLLVDTLVDCTTGQQLAYIIMDVYAPKQRQEDILTLEPGFWFGKDVRIPLFDEQATGQPGPSCFEAELIYHAVDVKNAARVKLRAELTSWNSKSDGEPDAPQKP
ncbi:hypothetical protein POL68_33650 [Stigmatella sp. ncwal1]|uniref:Uncharacterized protein n=1 Tax=Stigmatella ashevillensis TaxID=2995309 RepID=A0ABT5DK01_9BACT|nr:hypothetical protein [Stigmatella ashevillena]MDC0713458.1 hypothetical protein [Stigmatella ashevillena]